MTHDAYFPVGLFVFSIIKIAPNRKQNF